MQYSFSLTTFSPSGKLVQIEYALNAVAAGTTSLGLKATNGVVIATEKKLRSALVDETTVQRISTLTPNIGVAYSGMGPDSRVLVRKARKQAQAYYQLYKEQIPVAQLCREVATVMQEFTRKLPHIEVCWQHRENAMRELSCDIVLQSLVVCGLLVFPCFWQVMMKMGHSYIRLTHLGHTLRGRHLLLARI